MACLSDFESLAASVFPLVFGGWVQFWKVLTSRLMVSQRVTVNLAWMHDFLLFRTLYFWDMEALYTLQQIICVIESSQKYWVEKFQRIDFSIFHWTWTL